MSDENELDAETRRGLRILADSTKAKVNAGAAQQLYKAADSGNLDDYDQAEAEFDSLPVEQRTRIQLTAETKATTVRQTQLRRRATKNQQAETEESKSPPRTGSDQVDDDNSWEWKNSRDDLALESHRKRKPSNELEALRQEILRTLKN